MMIILDSINERLKNIIKNIKNNLLVVIEISIIFKIFLFKFQF